MQELLTIDQVAEKLQLKRGAVARLVKTLEFPAYKIGGSVRIGADELEEWVKTKKMNK